MTTLTFLESTKNDVMYCNVLDMYMYMIEGFCMCLCVGWWFVHMDDLNEGWVPATYLEPVYGSNESNKVFSMIVFHNYV